MRRQVRLALVRLQAARAVDPVAPGSALAARRLNGALPVAGRRRRRTQRQALHDGRRHGGAVTARYVDRALPAKPLARQHGHAFAAFAFSLLPHDGAAAVGVAVDAAFIVGTGAVAGHVAVARRQGEPADAGRGPLAMLRPMVAADPAHQRRRPRHARALAAGRPAPTVAQQHPAAVVRRGIAPRRIVDPGPAPRRDPRPAPVTVWHPAGRHRAGQPQGAIFRVVLPGAVAVQFFIACRIVRDIAQGRRGGGQGFGPVVERHALHGPRAQFLVRQLGALAGTQGHAARRAIHVGRAVEHADDAGAGRAFRFDAHPARLREDHAGLGRGQLEAAQCIGIAHAHADGAIAEVQFETVVIELAHFQLGIAIEAHGGRAHAKLGQRAAQGAQAVIRRDGPVQEGVLRVAVAGAHQHLPFDGGNAAHAGGRVLRQGQRARRRQQHGAHGVQEGGRQDRTHGSAPGRTTRKTCY